MNPSITTQDESGGYRLTESKIDKLLAYYNDARGYRESVVIPRASKNVRLLKGTPLEEENTRSKVTGRNKLYFRKIWSSSVRLLASMFQAYLQDKNKFKIVGRDEEQDHVKAKVLEIMTRYRFDWMMRRRNLFVKLLWAIFNCIAPGFAVVKQIWKYNEELGIDEPDFVVYPLEQVVLDWPELASGDSNNMRFIFFENYYTKDMLEELGYKNISKLTEQAKPQSELESARYAESTSPFAGSGTGNTNYSNGTVGSAYPERGTQNTQTNPYLCRYLALEGFYKEKGKLYYCVLHPDTKAVLYEAEVSPYGPEYPVSIGHMLIDPHKPVPEGLPEILEGPQESLNLTINLRKDNVMLAMNTGFIYSRFANVDKQSMRQLKPGFTIAADDINGVRPMEIRDVTQSSYIETNQYVNMIDEMSAVNPTKQGNSDTTKATVAQINLTEANAKHDLFVATVGQTLMHQFFYNLARHISMFETDERIFRVANEQLRKEGIKETDLDNYDLEFDFDLEVNVGMSEVSRGLRVQQITNGMQTMLQANNSTILAMKSGIGMKDPKIFNIAEAEAELLPELGMPNLKKYLIPVTPPPQPQQPGQGQSSAEGGEQSQVVEGQNAPQPNETQDVSPEFLNSIMGQLGG